MVLSSKLGSIEILPRSIGHGSSGLVYNVTGLFDGHHAVIKAVYIDFTMKEVDNLQRVDQFLAYGRRRLKYAPVYYIIMKYMGIQESETGLNDTFLKSLREKARSRYCSVYGMQQECVRSCTVVV